MFLYIFNADFSQKKTIIMCTYIFYNMLCINGLFIIAEAVWMQFIFINIWMCFLCHARNGLNILLKLLLEFFKNGVRSCKHKIFLNIFFKILPNVEIRIPTFLLRFWHKGLYKFFSYTQEKSIFLKRRIDMKIFSFISEPHSKMIKAIFILFTS